MTREQIVEATAEIEREFNANERVSQDTLRVWDRQLDSLRGHATAWSLPTRRIDQLQSQIRARRTSDDQPPKPTFEDWQTRHGAGGTVSRPKPKPAPPPSKPSEETRTKIDDLFK